MASKVDYKNTLDEIQKIVHFKLKVEGFKKKGRTHNKTLENGLIQVVNFQMGKYEFKNTDKISDLKPSLYGRFTVNLGVFVPELYEKTFDQKPKAFIQEFDCEIRTRINNNDGGNDIWYSLDSDYQKTAELIISQLKTDAKKWFNQFNNRTKIVEKLTESKEILFSPREKLCGAIIELQIDRKNGERIFNDYYNSLKDNSVHKSYVTELSKKLKVKLNKKPENKTDYNSTWLENFLNKSN